MKCLVLMMFLLVSCGVVPPHLKELVKNPLHDWIHDPEYKDPRRNRQSHPNFSYYILRFEEEYGNSIGDVPINFASDLKQRVGRDVAGVCWSWSTGEREIEINPDYWPDFIDEQREQLIFHELGHCVLNHNHDDSTMQGGCPNSIMRSWMFNISEIDNCYNPKYDLYLDNLFD